MSDGKDGEIDKVVDLGLARIQRLPMLEESIKVPMDLTRLYINQMAALGAIPLVGIIDVDGKSYEVRLELSK